MYRLGYRAAVTLAMMFYVKRLYAVSFKNEEDKCDMISLFSINSTDLDYLKY